VSLETRLRQGIVHSAAELEARNVDIEPALAGIRAAGDRRQRLQLVALGLAIVAVLSLALNANEISDMLSIERNLPPAERDLQDDRLLDEDAEITDANEGEGGDVTRTDRIGFGLGSDAGSYERSGSQVERSDAGPTAAHVSRGSSDEESALPSRSGERPVTIRFSYNVDAPWADDRPESEVSCSLRLPRGSDGVELLRAAVNQDCIRSFRTVIEHGREMLRCIDNVCDRATNSPGMVPDTRWRADWTGEKGNDSQSDYGRSGLKGFSASDGDSFTAYLYAVN
jgi:hypothetical protein